MGNAAMLLLFTAVVYGPAADGFVLLAAIGIGATAPQVAPLSRSRLVTIIGEWMPAERRARTVSGTMAYESAADETVFVFGPFLVGVLASALAPWAPLVGAAALTLVFVGAFALHPSGRHVSQDRTDDGRAPSAVSDLFRPQLLIVVLGILGVGIFFRTMLTTLTSFMADLGAPEQAGLLYGVMASAPRCWPSASPGSPSGSPCARAGSCSRDPARRIAAPRHRRLPGGHDAGPGHHGHRHRSDPRHPVQLRSRSKPPWPVGDGDDDARLRRDRRSVDRRRGGGGDR
ncbi:hypothetical protein AB1285_26300 [Microbacterium sp. NRRL B-14842]|uniref:hypothetical protein n=1 Tax=Microbacterium sp. NRRL B-14842 TaxID=3162881 RepID=UPI003D2681AF